MKAEDYTKADTYLSEGFKAGTPQEALLRYLGKSALLNIRETSWNSRSMSGGKGELDGTAVTETGGVVPLKLGFIKDWKINSIGRIRCAGGAGVGSAEGLCITDINKYYKKLNLFQFPPIISQET